MASYTITLQSPEGTETTFDCTDEEYILERTKKFHQTMEDRKKNLEQKLRRVVLQLLF